MSLFQLKTKYQPAGDQPTAIAKLNEGLKRGDREQTLLGVTGSGKTFTMANIIAEANRPTLILSHNKTLAAQLYGEFKEFFPNSAVHYFVSYFDYYQPEAYIARSDTYLKRTVRSTKRLTACAMLPPARSSADVTLLLLLRLAAFTALGALMIMLT